MTTKCDLISNVCNIDHLSCFQYFTIVSNAPWGTCKGGTGAVAFRWSLYTEEPCILLGTLLTWVHKGGWDQNSTVEVG